MTLEARQRAFDRAFEGNPYAAPTAEAFGGIAGGDPYERLDAVKEQALRDALPAAASYFQNSGMLNSSVAGERIGEAAARAVAPIEYNAYNADRGRQLQAMSMAPQLANLSYLDDEMMAQVGRAQDARSQAVLDDQAQLYYQTEDQDFNELARLSDMAMGFGGNWGFANRNLYFLPGRAADCSAIFSKRQGLGFRPSPRSLIAA